VALMPPNTFPLKFGDQVIPVRKILADDFTPEHHDIIAGLQYQPARLIFPDARWHSLYLGAGEEKAVFGVCDHTGCVFAIELIDERHYLNGRFVGGTYFFQKRIPALTGVKAQPDSEFGLMFTGLIKVREFVHGFEWGHFQFHPFRKTWVDSFFTAWLQSVYNAKYQHYCSLYKDVHDRNVLFEIRAFHESGFPLIVRNQAGRLEMVKIGIQPVDVR
jgi:hypothetical protein